MALLVAFIVRGLLRGTIAQVFAFSGILLGVLAGSAVAGWVGAHWQDARPAFLFLLLRWTVAVLAGFGVAAVFQWWGELLSKAVHEGPFGWLDRAVGAIVGAAIGILVCAAFVVLLLQVPGLEFARREAARGVTPAPLIAAADRASEWALKLPGGLWLHEQLRSASRRLATHRQA